MSGSQIEGSITEYVAGKEIDEAHNKDGDSGADNQAPESHAKVLLRCISLVEVGKDAVSEQNLSCTKHDEARMWAEKGPIPDEVVLEEWCFSEDEEAYGSD